MAPPNLSGKSVSLQQIADDANWVSRLEPFATALTGTASPIIFKALGGVDETQIRSLIEISSRELTEEALTAVKNAKAIRKATAAKTAIIGGAIGGAITANFSIIENRMKAHYGISSTERAVTNVVTDTLMGAGASYVASAAGATIGAGIGGPWGMVVGATVGGIAGHTLYDWGTTARDYICEQADFY